MGCGYGFRCKKCGYHFDAMLGVGMLFPIVYEETVKAGREGKFGEEIQHFLKEYPEGALNAENAAYRCGKCGRDAAEPVLTMYLPKDPGKEKDPEKGRWSVAFPGEGIDYVAPYELETEYKVHKIHPHFCSACGGRMRRMADRELKAGLRCPECGEMMEPSYELWD